MVFWWHGATAPAPSPPAPPDQDTPAMQWLRAETARMSPDQFTACWQKGLSPAALSSPQKEGAVGLFWRTGIDPE